MGKLRDSLVSATTLISRLEKSVDETGTKLENLAGEANMFLEGGWKGMNQLYLYVAEKVRKGKLKYKEVEKDPISKHSDNNVTGFVKELADIAKKVSDFGDRWTALADGIAGDISAFETQLTEIGKQLKKKKKKLLQSKKYKAKIAGYEAAMDVLTAKIQDLAAVLKKVKRSTPPSANRIQLGLGIKLTSTLKDLENMAEDRMKKLYESFKSDWAGTGPELSKMRKTEFSNDVKQLQLMIGDADGMEAESESEE